MINKSFLAEFIPIRRGKMDLNKAGILGGRGNQPTTTATSTACDRCGGSGSVACVTCDGTGYTITPEGDSIIACPMQCSMGQVACWKCNR
jgi:hypothetical protein